MAESSDRTGFNQHLYESGGKIRVDWIAQAAEAIDTLKGTSRLAQAMGVPIDPNSDKSTPFRIESQVVNKDQLNFLILDGVEPFENYFTRKKVLSIERKFPSGKVMRGVKHPPCEVIVVDSTQAGDATPGLRLRASAERSVDNIYFNIYEDYTYDLVIKDKEEDPVSHEELTYRSGRKPVEEMSVYEWDVAASILQQAWFDMQVEATNEIIAEQNQEMIDRMREAFSDIPQVIGIRDPKQITEGGSQTGTDPQNPQ